MKNDHAKYLGILSSLLAAVFTVLFGVFLAMNSKLLYFLFCLFLSMAVVTMMVSMKYFVRRQKLVFIDSAVAFSVMYALLVGMVYYTQIPPLRGTTFSSEALKIVSDIPGSVFFYIDMFGYWFLCLATLFVALALDWKHRILRLLLFIHSAIGIPTFLIPFSPVLDIAGEASSGFGQGVLILVIWCAIFAPICLLLAKYFIDAQPNDAAQAST